MLTKIKQVFCRHSYKRVSAPLLVIVSALTGKVVYVCEKCGKDKTVYVYLQEKEEIKR